jgi:hypothetical protein
MCTDSDARRKGPVFVRVVAVRLLPSHVSTDQGSGHIRPHWGGMTPSGIPGLGLVVYGRVCVFECHRAAINIGIVGNLCPAVRRKHGPRSPFILSNSRHHKKPKELGASFLDKYKPITAPPSLSLEVSPRTSCSSTTTTNYS